ncbi:hypothetical protein LCGC14_2904370 [marine sediment metagenome]|uniref:Uncharacterized protein n=1 Tax=marine sediment metagenome TaxID=412755 RepID=A0A0F8XTI2_9ZZZZ
MERNMQEDLKKVAAAFFKVFFDYFELDSLYFGSIDFELDYMFGDSWIEREILRAIEWEPERPDEEDWRLVYSEKQLVYARDLYYKKLMPYLEELWVNENKNKMIKIEKLIETNKTLEKLLKQEKEENKELKTKLETLYLIAKSMIRILNSNVT